MSRRDAAHQGVAVALGLTRTTRRPALRDGVGAVAAAVVGDDNLAGNVGLGDTFPSLSDANLKCVGFVEARHDDGNFGRAEWRGLAGSRDVWV